MTRGPAGETVGLSAEERTPAAPGAARREALPIDSDPAAAEAALRAEFATREEPFAHGAFSARVLLPAEVEGLIDVEEFERDERIPYWADLWPSARALARHLLEAPAPAGRVLELGCGVALPSLALLSRGAEVVATDYYDAALRFARANAARNGLGTLRTAMLDWREKPALGRFPLAVAADVLYERRNANALAALLPRVVKRGGAFLLADPGRTYLADFRERMRAGGWREEPLEVRSEPSPSPHSETMGRIGIVRWWREG